MYRQKGFGLVQILLLIVLVGMIGGTGYYVWQNKDIKKSSNSADNTAKQITNFDECVAAGNPVMESFPEQCAANGQTFVNGEVEQQKDRTKSANGLFSIKLPDGWSVVSDTEQDTFAAAGYESLMYEEGTPATVIRRAIPGSDNRTVFSIFASKQEYQGWTDDSAVKEDFELSNGTKGTKYSQTYEETQDGLGGATKGEVRYEYSFKGSELFVHVAYTVLPGETNQLEILETSLKTLRIQ